MKKPEMKYLLTEYGVKKLNKTICLARKNRRSLLVLTFVTLLQQAQLDILRNDLYHHIQEYHRTEGD